ncbi:MAG: nitroreductase family protein [Caldicoprobacterales bacterium]
MLLDIMKTRRSIRVYKDQEVEQEKVDIILKSALLAPDREGNQSLGVYCSK